MKSNWQKNIILTNLSLLFRDIIKIEPGKPSPIIKNLANLLKSQSLPSKRPQINKKSASSQLPEGGKKNKDKNGTNKNILLQNSYFDSSFNSVQSINTNLHFLKKDNTINPIIYAIVRASRSIRVPRDHLKIIRLFKGISPYFNKYYLSTLAFAKLLRIPKVGTPSLTSFASWNKALPREQKDKVKVAIAPGLKTEKCSSEAAATNILVVAKRLKNLRKKNIDLKSGASPKVASCLPTNLSNSFLNLSFPNEPKDYKLYKKIFNSNLLLRNKNFDSLRSNLSIILKKRIKSFSEILAEIKNKDTLLNLPKKNFILSQYLQNCIQTKLSLNKYKARVRIYSGSFISYKKIIGYNFNGYKSNNIKNLNSSAANITYFNNAATYKLLYYFFKSMYCLISKPVFKYTNDKIIIQLFYYLNIPKKKIFRLFSIFYINSFKKIWKLASQRTYLKNKESYKSNYLNSVGINRRFVSNKFYIRWRVRKAISRLKKKINLNLFFKLRKFNLTKVATHPNKFNSICEILSNSFNRPVELQLTRLHHPYLDSNILVTFLALNFKRNKIRGTSSSYALQKIKKFSANIVKDLNDPNLISVNRIPAFLSGLNIKVSGRLMGDPIIPRVTTKAIGKGASATGKVNYLDTAKITSKNRKGAYTIKVTSGQNFF